MGYWDVNYARNEADSKQEELRLMVGYVYLHSNINQLDIDISYPLDISQFCLICYSERYRDLLHASTSIIFISAESKRVTQALADVEDASRAESSSAGGIHSIPRNSTKTTIIDGPSPLPLPSPSTVPVLVLTNPKMRNCKNRNRPPTAPIPLRTPKAPPRRARTALAAPRTTRVPTRRLALPHRPRRLSFSHAFLRAR